MASTWEKAISILAGNLNSGRSYLITAVKSEKENVEGMGGPKVWDVCMVYKFKVLSEMYR